MSQSQRTTLTIVLIILLAGTSFAAGYVTNDAVALNSGDGDSVNVGLFREAWDLVQDNYLGELPDATQVTYGAIRGALSTVGDPYTVFIEPPAREEERERLQGNFGGIGAFIERNEAGEVLLDPIPDNPAAQAGILSGDQLIAVDGQPISDELTVQQIAEQIKGEKGTKVTLTVIHPDETEPVDITITRGDILIPSVSFTLLDEDPTIGYIRLTRFSGESGNEIENAITSLQEQGAEQLILDIRGNGGGLLDAAVAVADHFLVDVPVLYQQRVGQDEQVYEVDGTAIAEDMPLVVLIDGGTASASEILAGALRDHDRAMLIGHRSFGKGSVQLVFDLSDGSSVHVTSSRWFTPDRQQLDQEGLEPDILVEVTQEAIDAGRDEMLNSAIEYLQSGN